MIKVKYEENLVEISESAITKLLVLLIIMPILATLIYMVESYSPFGNEKYIFIVVLSFFFVLITLSLLPLINYIRHQGTRLMVWSVSKAGVIIADKLSTLTEYRQPITFPWSDIKTILFVDKLVIKDIEGTSVYYRQFIVILTNKKFGDTWLKMSRNSISKMDDDTHYLTFTLPKPEKNNIIKYIKQIVPDSVLIQEKTNYEIK